MIFKCISGLILCTQQQQYVLLILVLTNVSILKNKAKWKKTKQKNLF